MPKVEAEKLAALSADVAPPVEPAKAGGRAATEPPVATPSTEETPAETKTAALDAPPRAARR